MSKIADSQVAAQDVNIGNETVEDVNEIIEDVNDGIDEETDDISEEAKEITVGGVYTGTVLKIKPFGAIVSLPGSPPGLVHISQIAAGYVQSVEDVLEIGDEVSVLVLSRDDASGKIALSMKDVPQGAYDDEDFDGDYFIPPPPVVTPAAAAAFEEKFKAWQKVSNERIAGLNKRNKRR